MAPTYRLKFFDFMGVAEPIRYLFAYGNIHYENVIVHRDAEWTKLQKVVPFGKLPILEVDNRVLYQSVAISRYLGQLVGLLPNDYLEAAELDAVATTVFDLGVSVHDWYHEENVERKTVVGRNLEENVFPRFLKDFEEIVRLKGGYFGGKVYWADVYFVGIIESIQGMLKKDILQPYPTLYQLFNNVRNISQIKNYINKRPKYLY